MVENISEKEKKIKSYLPIGLSLTFWDENSKTKQKQKRHNGHLFKKSCYGIEETLVIGWIPLVRGDWDGCCKHAD